MPTYEFRCTACKHQFEVFQSMSAPDPEACEQCGAAQLEKVLFPVAVHYKGSGFYNTDYGSAKAGSGDSGASAGSTEGGSSNSKSDSTGTSSGGSSDTGSSTSSAPSAD